MSHIEYVLFDIDGTMLNTNELIIKAFQHTFKTHLNFEINKSDIISFFGEPLHSTFARFSSDLIEEMIKTFQEFDVDHHRLLVKFFPGIPEIVAQLHAKGIHLGIITSKEQLAVNICEHIGDIRKFFNTVVTLDDTEEPKPSPKPIKKALEQLNYHCGEVLMVGDSPLDIKSAKNAGVLSAVVSWTMYPMEKVMLEKPDFVLAKPSDLLKICAKSKM